MLIKLLERVRGKAFEYLNPGKPRGGEDSRRNGGHEPVYGWRGRLSRALETKVLAMTTR